MRGSRGPVIATLMWLFLAGSSVVLGKALAEGRWSSLIVLILAGLTVAAIAVGARWFGIVVLLTCALPFYSQSYRFPLIWAAVALWVVVGIGGWGGIKASSVRLRPIEVLLPLLLVLSAIVANIAGSQNQSQGLASMTISLLAGVAVYYLVATTFADPKWHRRAMLALLFGGLVVLTVSLVMLIIPGFSLPGMTTLSSGFVMEERGLVTLRLTGPLGDYELLSEMLALGAVGFFAMSSGEERRMRLLLVVCGAAMIGGVLLTGTRGGFLILVFGMLLLAAKRQSFASASKVTIAVLLSGAALAVYLAVFPDSMAVFARFGLIRQGVGWATVINRGAVWSQFMQMLGSSPGLIFGRGAEFDFNRIGTYPHSLYIFMLYSQGMVGLALMVALLVRLVAPLLRFLREKGVWSSYTLGPVLMAMFIVDQVKIEYVRLYPYQMWIWALFGLTAIGTRVHQRVRDAGDEQ